MNNVKSTTFICGVRSDRPLHIHVCLVIMLFLGLFHSCDSIVFDCGTKVNLTYSRIFCALCDYTFLELLCFSLFYTSVEGPIATPFIGSFGVIKVEGHVNPRVKGCLIVSLSIQRCNKLFDF